MIELGNQILKEISLYIIKVNNSFLPESTKTLGRTLLLFSVFLILIFTNILKVTEGDFMGIKIDLGNIANNKILFYVVFSILFFFSFQYLFDYTIEIQKWKLENSVEKLKIKELVNKIELLNQENQDNLKVVLKNNSEGFDAFLEKRNQIKKIDDTLSTYFDHCWKKILRTFVIKKIFDLMPIFAMGFAVFLL